MKNVFVKSLKNSPVIAGVKDIDDLDKALDSECKVIFLLCGNIFNLKECVSKAHKKGKIIFIHVDLVEGFSRDSTALRYISSEIGPDGIISTKNNLLKSAKAFGLLTVQRIFIIDSLSIGTAIKASQTINPDAVEIMLFTGGPRYRRRTCQLRGGNRKGTRKRCERRIHICERIMEMKV